MHYLSSCFSGLKISQVSLALSTVMAIMAISDELGVSSTVTVSEVSEVSIY